MNPQYNLELDRIASEIASKSNKIPTPTITSDNLNQGTPLTFPPQPISSMSGLFGYYQSLVEQNRKNQEQDFALKTARERSSRDELVASVNELAGRGSEQSRLETEADITGKTQKVTNYTNELESEQRALTNQVEAIRKNPTGMLAGAVESEVARVSRESLSKQADLAILQNAANRDLATAQSNIDRKIQIKYEPIKEKITFLKDFYQNNLDALTKSEQNQLAQKTKEEERAYNQAVTQDKNAYDLFTKATENGAPESVQRSILKAIDSGNYREAQRLAGPYQINPLDQQIKQQQLRKLEAETALLGTDITTPDINKYAGALNVILGSSTLTKDQKRTVVNSINSGQDPVAVIKNQAKNIMGQTLATSLDKYETAKAQMESIDSLLKDYYSKGGSTGILTGNYEKVVNKLGEVNDPRLVDIATNISAALQIYRNAVSGTAYSVQEGKDIASIFPGINKSSGLNNAILSGRMKAFDTTIDATYRNTLGKSYDEIKTSSAPVEANPFQQALLNIFNPQTGLFNIPN